MTKTKYEQERDENKGGKGKRLVSDNPESDTEYDPSSDIDNQSDSANNSDDDLNNEVNTEERPMVPGTRPQQKKQKVTTMAAANQQRPRTPTRITRQKGQTYEGEPRDDLVPAPLKNVRKKTMGHGLEKMLNRGKKLAIQVAEEKKRPDVPHQAAKLASETGVALRDNMPIYTSWKLYDNDAGKAEVKKVLDKVASRLDVDVKNEAPSKVACTDITKRGVRQTRYHLKKKYFDESLIEEQLLAKQPPPKMKKEEWTKLEKCAKNKVNRAQVQLHQRIGARSYIAHRYSLEQMVAEKEKEPEEGEEQKSPSKIVANYLSQISRSSTFLPNIGVPRPSKTGQSTSTAAQARLQAQFEETLQAEREEAARKQEELQAQLQAQQAALEENQSLLRQTQEEVKGMHTKFEETNALLRAVLKLQKD
ncbi:uncharacterized protein [Miscanthus floridulus]|uniref:uncharacterized protein n=1 Tax=Miscanthus floridulus TaxID=154761 RepID=UPI00345B4705